jgi:hypothetical protein
LLSLTNCVLSLGSLSFRKTDSLFFNTSSFEGTAETLSVSQRQEHLLSSIHSIQLEVLGRTYGSHCPQAVSMMGISGITHEQLHDLVTHLRHSLTHGAEPFLRSCQLCSHSRTSQHLMEPEGSLPRSQESSTHPYSEPDQSNPYHPILSLSDPF